MVGTLHELLDTLPQIGQVEWIGIRPARKAPMVSIESVQASPDSGLDGDRYSGKTGRRHVTLLQAEHLAVIGSCLDHDGITPEALRRNIVVRGINLLALKGRDIVVGAVVLRVTGLCHPCSRMETILGPGGYNAMRGHGGITARVIAAGGITVGDNLSVAAPQQTFPRTS